MWKAGLTDYSEFCHRLLAEITDRPISFEVFADEPDEIRRQARTLAEWGANVYVKVPVTTTRGESLAPVVQDLSRDGVQVNVTALFTPRQVARDHRRGGRRRAELHLGVRRAGSPTPAATPSRSCARRWRSCARRPAPS